MDLKDQYFKMSIITKHYTVFMQLLYIVAILETDKNNFEIYMA